MVDLKVSSALHNNYVLSCPIYLGTRGDLGTIYHGIKCFQEIQGKIRTEQGVK